MEATCPHLTQALLASWKDLAKLITGRRAPWRSMVGVFQNEVQTPNPVAKVRVLAVKWVMESDAREAF